MTSFAPFYKVKELINSIDNIKTIEDAKNVFNSFITDHDFQNEYGIKQLYDIMHCCFMSNFKHKNEMLYLTCLVIEHYKILNKYVNNLMVPVDCDYTLYLPTEEEPLYLKNGFTLREIRRNTILEITKNDNMIMVINFVGDFNLNNTNDGPKDEKFVCVSFSKFGDININKDIDFNITFGNIEYMSFARSYVPYIDPVEQIIINDDVDGLLNVLSQRIRDEDKSTLNSFNKYKVYSSNLLNLSNKLTLMELCVLYGSIKCFKLLYLRGYDYGEYVYSLVFGGNLEMFHLFESNNKLYNIVYVMLSIIKSHNIELFEYWFNKHYEYTDIEYIESVIIEAMYYKNYNVIEYVGTVCRETCDKMNLLPLLTSSEKENGKSVLQFLNMYK